MKFNLLFSVVMTLGVPNFAFALTDAFVKPKSGLFSNFESAHFQLKAPLTTLFKAKKLNFFEMKKVKVPGVLSYVDQHKEVINLNLEIHIKGFTSAKFCSFPKLELKIPKSESAGTIFEGIKNVDLNTHCVEQDDPSTEPYIQYIKSSFNNHREAKIYEIMDLLNMPSLRAKPVLVQYTDTDELSEISAKPNFSYQAFFLEDFSDFRKKNSLMAIRGVNDVTKADVEVGDTEKMSTYVFSNVADSLKLDLDDAARSALLQFFIGNSDWFIQTTKTDYREKDHPESENLWNVKIVEDSNGRWITIPQDFNFSMFMQNYLVVPPINSKVFDLVNDQTKLHLLEEFKLKKDLIYQTIKSLDGADSILQRLDMVYTEIDRMIFVLSGQSQ